MLVRSSGSVTIISLDVEATLHRLRNAAQELLERDQDVQSVWLFGSLATGDALPGSDVDILIILEQSEYCPVKRLTAFVDDFSGLGIPVDVFSYTETEIDEMLRVENSFVRTMLDQRIRLA